MSEEKGFKHVGLITKKKDQSFEEFVDHWLKVHSDIAVHVPGLRKYVINPIDREKYPDSPIDGFSELWFDSLEAAEEAFSSPAGREAFADVPNFADHVAVTYLTEIRRF
ncbi:EthD family reductase [Pokkaliibacter plantistimulans]|uniref:EthD family reductase n=1 Tax=Proteobacteria bacterium 228 TaxID=2083153 RepID=A0A2S5KIL7_9PROT|nr:EthD family reductase [Pokkaliibacter plantistimulans]PPC74206.1 EthD family reductase [Pokkaliibacter plantistimulans]